MAACPKTGEMFLASRRLRKVTNRRIALLTTRLSHQREKLMRLELDIHAHQQWPRVDYAASLDAAKRAELLRLGSIDPTWFHLIWHNVRRDTSEEKCCSSEDCVLGDDVPQPASFLQCVFDKRHDEEAQVCIGCAKKLGADAAGMAKRQRKWVKRKLTKPYAAGLTLEEVLNPKKTE